MASSSSVPTGASAAVLKPSDPIPKTSVSVQGPNFDEAITLDGLLESYKRIGFQANSLGKAIEIVNKMVCSENQSFLSRSNHKVGLFSVAGAWLMSQWLKMKTTNSGTQKFALKRDAKSSSAILPTSSHLACAR